MEALFDELPLVAYPVDEALPATIDSGAELPGDVVSTTSAGTITDVNGSPCVRSRAVQTPRSAELYLPVC